MIVSYRKSCNEINVTLVNQYCADEVLEEKMNTTSSE